MRRGLQVDPLQCPSCGDCLAHRTNILERDAIRRILRHLGLRAEPRDPARRIQSSVSAPLPSM
jgi:hypothetical protein